MGAWEHGSMRADSGQPWPKQDRTDQTRHNVCNDLETRTCLLFNTKWFVCMRCRWISWSSRAIGAHLFLCAFVCKWVCMLVCTYLPIALVIARFDHYPVCNSLCSLTLRAPLATLRASFSFSSSHLPSRKSLDLSAASFVVSLRCERAGEGWRNDCQYIAAFVPCWPFIRGRRGYLDKPRG